MYSYEVWQWVLILFIYCFVGWIWETSYVSIKEGHFVNRGFMNGPFLPIYGSGAITILFVALPVKDNPILVFLFGMIAATILELIAGILILKIFKVRYWDYSYRKIQYKGHICLVSSIAWGVFSCLLVYVIHRPIEKLIYAIPESAGQMITMIFTVINSADFATSFKTALELRNILITGDDIKRQIERLERRAEIIEVFMADSAEKRTTEIMEHISDIVDMISESKENAAEELLRVKKERDMKATLLLQKLSYNKSISDLIRRNPYANSPHYSEMFTAYKRRTIDSINNNKGIKEWIKRS